MAGKEPVHLDGAELIARERERQIEKEDYQASDDDRQTAGELALAAVCYATPERLSIYGLREDRDPWPWDGLVDKRLEHPDDDEPPDPARYPMPKRIDLLVKAGALIAAEIDRLLRKGPG